MRLQDEEAKAAEQQHKLTATGAQPAIIIEESQWETETMCDDGTALMVENNSRRKIPG
ncbi:uncharacterized protein DS421_11g338530 [Arachis hypogaea]|nr:uncharacterized protein DS421_11g338530 [Arachis hypogaea]